MGFYVIKKSIYYIMSLSSESNFGVSVSDQTKIIRDSLNDWAIEQRGVCIVCNNIEEQVLTGFDNVMGPVVLIQFLGEESIGDESVQELLGHVRRSFDILIKRGRLQCSPLSSPLVKTEGSVRAFYDLVEEARDIVRCIVWPSPMTTNPSEYHNIRPLQTDNWLLDSYVINISIVTQIGRVQALPTQLGGGQGNDFVQLSDPLPQDNNA